MLRGFALMLVLLSACGPVPLDRAERQCFDRARLAESPRGQVRIGAGSGGPRAGLTLSISSDYIQGRDPSALYDSCVFRKSGQPPSRPYYSLPARGY